MISMNNRYIYNKSNYQKKKKKRNIVFKKNKTKPAQLVLNQIENLSTSY